MTTITVRPIRDDLSFGANACASADPNAFDVELQLQW